MAAELGERKLPQLDLHEMMPDDVEVEIDQFLVHCFAEGKNAVKIIYGIGDGVMRKKVAPILKEHPLVEKINENFPGFCIALLGEKSS